MNKYTSAVHNWHKGIRLACQVLADQDLRIVLLSPARESCWKSPLNGEIRRIRQPSVFPLNETPQEIKNPYGVAVDLGTTRMQISLHNVADNGCAVVMLSILKWTLVQMFCRD